MNIDDMIFVSADDHVVEMPDMFEGRSERASGASSSRRGILASDAPAITDPKEIR